MNDLADQIDDYICTFEGVADLTMDTLAMVIFGWALIALFLLWLCKFLYNKYFNKDIAGSKSSAIDSSKYGMSPSEKIWRSESKDISASKDIKGLDLAARPMSKTNLTSAAVRKRLSRKSPGPELKKTLRSIPPPTNVVGPETASVTWTSQVFRWLYSDLVIVNDLLQSWVQALNDNMKKNAEENRIGIEIVRVLPESPSPVLANIFCNSAEADPSYMTITMDCDSTPVMQIKTYRQRAGKMETSHYKVTVSRLRARLTIKMSYNTLKGEMTIEGYPDIRIAMNSIGAIKTIDSDEKQLQDSVSEILAGAIRICIYPIDFSIYATCPRANENSRELSYDIDAVNMTASLQGVSSGRRLLVKVVKGEGLIYAKDPFCVIEMDEPQQKNQTGARQGSNPYWDEHFLFEMSSQSAEILFEVYDRSRTGVDEPPRFLGLGLVGVDELLVGPASSQILALQPRPYEADDVQGAITIEFVFIEGAEVPAGRRPYKMKEALKINNGIQPSEGIYNGSDIADTAIRALEGGALSYNGNPSKSTLIIHSVQRNMKKCQKVEVNSEETFYLKETANESNINDTENKKENGSDSTFKYGSSARRLSDLQQQIGKNIRSDEKPANDLLINDQDNFGISENHSINNHNIPNKIDDVESDQTNATISNDSQIDYMGKSNNRDMDNIVNDSDNTRPNKNPNTDVGRLPGEPIAQSTTVQNNFINHQNVNGNLNNETNAPHTDPKTNDLERSRSHVKRDFFGTLKRRLGRSKSRAKSLERSGAVPIDAEHPTGQRIVVPSTFDQSRRSSLSESSAISGFSSASARTFLHESSTLVLETAENGVKRHFLVPLSIAQRPRWRRKGTKLHIYNDHTFIAKHLSGGLTCNVCNRSITRRPGKQGYECRDCQLKCHKQCHVRTPQTCPNPTVLSMELSKINTAAADRSIRKL